MADYGLRSMPARRSVQPRPNTPPALVSGTPRMGHAGSNVERHAADHSPSGPRRAPLSSPPMRSPFGGQQKPRDTGPPSARRGLWRPPQQDVPRASTPRLSRNAKSPPRSRTPTTAHSRASPRPGRRAGRALARQVASPQRGSTSSSSDEGPRYRRGNARVRSSSYSAGGRAVQRRDVARYDRTGSLLQDGGSMRFSDLSPGNADVSTASVSSLVHQCAQLQRKVDYLERVRDADKQLAESLSNGSRAPGRAAVELLECQEQRLERMYLGSLSLERRVRVSEQIAAEHKQRAEESDQLVATLKAQLTQAKEHAGSDASPRRPLSDDQGDHARRQVAAEKRRADAAEAMLGRSRQKVTELEKEVERLTVRETELARAAEAASNEVARYAAENARLSARARELESRAPSEPRVGEPEAASEAASLRQRVHALEAERDRHREVRVGLRQEISELTRRLVSAGLTPPLSARVGSDGAQSRTATPRPVAGANGTSQLRARSPAAFSDASAASGGHTSGDVGSLPRSRQEPGRIGGRAAAPDSPSGPRAHPPPRRTPSPRPEASPRGPVGVGSAGCRTPRGDPQLRVGDWIWYDDGAEPPQHAMVVESARHENPPTYLVRLSDGRERRAQHPDLDHQNRRSDPDSSRTGDPT